MTNALITIGSIVVLLGVVILVHEWGHFIVARLCGVRVDVFSIGMGPRLWGVRRGATDYRISAFPVGGYVKMAGENPIEERAGAPDEFLSKKRWQRALIILAGPGMNVVLAIVVASAMLMAGRGEPEFLRSRPLISLVPPGSPAAQAGLESGDTILAVNGKRVATWDDVQWRWIFVAPTAKIPVNVERGGRKVSLSIQNAPGTSEGSLFGYPAWPVVIGSVDPGYPAAQAGLQPGDRVVAIDGKPASRDLLAWTTQASKGHPMALTVLRGGRQLQLTLHPAYGKYQGQESWYIGVLMPPPATIRTNRVTSAISRGVRYNVLLTAEIVNLVFQLAEHKAPVKELMGPVGIAQASSQAAHEGLLAFLNFLAFISLDLGIVQLLPIPILDGWHLLTLGVEGTLRRDLSLAVKERALQVGVVFLLLLILLVTYNDILRLVLGSH